MIQMVDMPLREENAAVPPTRHAYQRQPYENEDRSFQAIPGPVCFPMIFWQGQLNTEERSSPFLDKTSDMLLLIPVYDVINKEYHMKDGIITRRNCRYADGIHLSKYNYSYRWNPGVVAGTTAPPKSAGVTVPGPSPATAIPGMLLC